MQLTVIGRSDPATTAWQIAAAFFVLVPLAGPALADSAFISQLGPGSTAPLQFAIPFQAPPQTPNGSLAPSFVHAPVTASPSGNVRNLAMTAVFGNFNQTLQVQLGTNDQSALGVFGNNDTAGVFQLGNNLRSNIDVLGQGLTVGVIEPNGTPPVDMLIARLPSGRLLIVR